MRSAISDDEADVPGAERVRVLAFEECRRFDNLRRNLDDVGVYQLSLRLRLSELSAPAARSALSTFMTRSMGSTGF